MVTILPRDKLNSRERVDNVVFIRDTGLSSRTDFVWNGNRLLFAYQV